MFISSAFAQTAPAAAAEAPSLLASAPIFIAMFAVMYFVMIRPQMKKQKELKAMLEALVKGDEVVTIGGVLGKVNKIDETYIRLEVANGLELQVQRSAVVQVLPKGTIK